MIVQINTDKTIIGDQRSQEYFTSMIEDKFKRFEPHITRIEMHLSDQDGRKEGFNDLQCLLEARMEGRDPLAVTCKSDSLERAVTGAIDKLKASLDSTIGRMKDF